MMAIKRIPPKAGQESVWDYPRPPRLEASESRIRVVFAGVTIAESQRSLRVLETSHPPVYYLPPEDVLMQHLQQSEQQTFCEFKGSASYWTVVVNSQKAKDAAWSYSEPMRGFEALRGYLAFYPSRVDACFVDNEQVQAQAGDFYGGWITSKVVGPFKGSPGTWGW